MNAVRKNWDDVQLTIALAFPDLYEIGTSHFGLQILYEILNRKAHIAAERVFAPATDMAHYLKTCCLPLTSLETGTPLKQFDILGFSLLYELNYTNVLMMLDLAGIPFLSKERDETHPLIIAGGPCTCNPEPMADFFDAMVIGDGEEVILEMIALLIGKKPLTIHNRLELLHSWSKIEGVYIPSFFEPKYESNKTGNIISQTLIPHSTEYTSIKRAILPQLNNAPFPQKPILPYGKPVHDRLRLEIGRGCSRGCRFCQAGMIYRPVRERSLQNLLEITETSLKATGYEDISLLSLSTGDYGCLIPLMENLIRRYQSQQIAISLPSIRAGTLTSRLMELIREVRKTGFTIAPEAGTQRLRDVINKNITEKEIFETITSAFELGWQVIKLYFMIGHPTETDEDLQGIVDLVSRLKKIKAPKGRKPKLNVSITTFIPKPHTPFQWARQLSLEESTAKIEWLKKKLRMPGVQLKWQHPELSLLEGLWARGDRRLGQLLIAAYQKGCRFDGWTDHFRFDLWQTAWQESSVDPADFVLHEQDVKDPLPWDHIDMGISRRFLYSEWEKAFNADLTQDCRQGTCNGCGICDFKDIRPRIFPDDISSSNACHVCKNNGTHPPVYKKLKVVYAKIGLARFFGHLEMVNIFLRAIRRADIPVKYTNGFHPKPKISFADPLPLGISSECEWFYLTVPEHIQPAFVKTALNPQLPDGLRIKMCCPASSEKKGAGSNTTSSVSTYQITLQNDQFDRNRLQDFYNASVFMVTRLHKKGNITSLNLKDIISDITLLDVNQLKLTVKNETGKTVRPAEVLTEIFGFSEKHTRQARILKLAGQTTESEQPHVYRAHR
jgi:radical SAM family uncharacterized protein/radical SAM-linked protein